MEILELKNVSKVYKNGEENKYALKDVNISFSNPGVVCILGKSGCGKSTLLNIMSLIDKPSSGGVYFYGENTQKWNKKKVNDFHTNQIGIVFQHYCLLEDESVLFNLMLPMLISGKKECECNEDAVTLLKSIKIKETLYEEKVCNLSGGEKERIALLRAIINDPKIVFADEPTGALDKANAELVMDVLKKISKKKLVIMVSHNKNLVEKYADRVIEISDGKIINDKVINARSDILPLVKNRKQHKSKKWISKIVKSNYKKRFGFHSFSIVSSIFGLSSALLIFGFTYNSKNSVHNQLKNHFDYETSSLTKEIKTSQIGNGLSIVKTLRPDIEELYSKESNICKNFYICLNYDSLVKPVTSVYINNKSLNSITLSSVYSFERKNDWNSKIIDGTIPSDDLTSVVINETCFKFLEENGFKNQNKVTVKSEFEYVVNDRLIDIFTFEKEFEIKCIVKELDFLNTPKIYYSYSALDEYMKNVYSNGQTWKSIIEEADGDTDITCYSYKLFLRNREYDISKLEINNGLSLTSNALIINNAVEDFCDIGSRGMIVYLIIAISGVVLIVGITTFFNYTRDKKKIALLYCLGTSFNDACEMYTSEAVIDGLFSFPLSIILTAFIEWISNLIIETTTGLKSMILIPWFKFMNIDFGFPLIAACIFLALILVSSFIPLIVSKRISIKEELKEE